LELHCLACGEEVLHLNKAAVLSQLASLSQQGRGLAKRAISSRRTRIYGSSAYLELALNLGNLGESDRARLLACGELPWGRLVNQLIRAIRWQRTVARAVGEHVLASQLIAHISQLRLEGRDARAEGNGGGGGKRVGERIANVRAVVEALATCGGGEEEGSCAALDFVGQLKEAVWRYKGKQAFLSKAFAASDELWSRLREDGAVVTDKQIVGAYNSCLKRLATAGDYMLTSEYLHQLQAAFGELTIDALALAATALLPRFWSAGHTKGSSGVDTFVQS
ncbi:MAG: hypothetical protein SGPRY_012634, partial [Prymnesium sp.]